MPHRNAPLTETGRLRLARCVVEDGWPLRRAAERFQVSVDHRAALGRPLPRARRGRDGRPVQPPAPQPAPDPDPHRAADHQGAGAAPVGTGPHRATCCGLAPSTVHRVLTRYGLARLAHLDRATGRAGPPLRTRPRPATWCTSTSRSSATSPTAAATGSSAAPAAHAAHRRQAAANVGYSLPAHRRGRPLPPGLHRDPARRDARRPPPRSGPGPRRSSPPPASPSQRVLTDNGSCYRSHLWRDTLAAAGITHKRTRALPAPDQRQGRTVPVRHEAPCRIPGSAGRNSEGGSWV